MDKTKYFLSERGNIWSVDSDYQSVECNGHYVTNDFEVAAWPDCEVGGELYVEDHHTNAGTTSGMIVATNSRLSDEQAKYIVEELDKLRKKYGPLRVSNENGDFMVSIFIGEGLHKDKFEPHRMNVAVLDFHGGKIKEIDHISVRGHKLAAEEHWSIISDIVDVFNDSIPFDSDYTLDGYNLDAKDEKTENAYVRISEKKFDKERESVVQEKNGQEK